MNNTPDKEYPTLESIIQRKNELHQQIAIQQENIIKISKQLTAPLTPATNKANAIMRMFNTGIAVLDGIKLGIKLMHKFRKLFRRESY